MEVFNRAKALLFNPKEEWEVIEAENEPHTKVLPYLLVLALIPAFALFFNYWWEWHSDMDRLTEAVHKAIVSAVNNEYVRTTLNDSLAAAKELDSFNILLGIVKSLQILVIIVGSAYIVTMIINLLSDQFGLKKDFNRSFSLVAYSFTPLCIAGVLYAYTPLTQFVPYIGLYGLYLLYLGIKPLISPPAEKIMGYFIMTLVVALATYIIIPKIVQPVTDEISKSILIDQLSKAEYNGKKLVDDKFIEGYKELKYDEIESALKKDRDNVVDALRH